VPRRSRSRLRSLVEFGGRTFKLPVVPANMKTGGRRVRSARCSPPTATSTSMHRFDLDNVAYAKRMRDKGLYVSISSGVKQARLRAVDRPAWRPTGVGRRLHHDRHRARPRRQRAADDRPHQAEAAATFVHRRATSARPRR
jgi:hypothetical protein